MAFGRSPRIRGKHNVFLNFFYYNRSIPAYTGKTRLNPRQLRFLKVDPRVYGENQGIFRPATRPAGRSPRIRGKLKPQNTFGLPLRSIPAYTGKTRASSGQLHAQQVDPRVYGENEKTQFLVDWLSGRSPRIRGKRY